MDLFYSHEYNSSWKINNHLHARYNGARGKQKRQVKETDLDMTLKGIL